MIKAQHSGASRILFCMVMMPFFILAAPTWAAARGGPQNKSVSTWWGYAAGNCLACGLGCWALLTSAVNANGSQSALSVSGQDQYAPALPPMTHQARSERTLRPILEAMFDYCPAIYGLYSTLIPKPELMVDRDALFAVSEMMRAFSQHPFHPSSPAVTQEALELLQSFQHGSRLESDELTAKRDRYKNHALFTGVGSLDPYKSDIDKWEEFMKDVENTFGQYKSEISLHLLADVIDSDLGSSDPSLAVSIFKALNFSRDIRVLLSFQDIESSRELKNAFHKMVRAQTGLSDPESALSHLGCREKNNILFRLSLANYLTGPLAIADFGVSSGHVEGKRALTQILKKLGLKNPLLPLYI